MHLNDMSKKLTVVLASRDDNYGDDALDGIYNLNFTPLKNIDRTRMSIENNLNLLSKFLEHDYELIVVDWSPIKEKYLHNNIHLKELFNHPNLKSIIVEPSAIEKVGLNVKGFNEYFAKNVGIRNSLGKYILVINSDGLLSKNLVKEINTVISDDEKNFYFRQHSRIDIDNNQKKINEGLSFYDNSLGSNKFKKTLFTDKHQLDMSLNIGKKEIAVNPNFYNIIGTPAAGDFTLSYRDNFIEISTGYFEDLNNPIGENFRQTARDGQLLVNFILHGIYPKKFKNSIKSFDHNKIERVGEIKFHAYRNNANWGFNDFDVREYEGRYFISA